MKKLFLLFGALLCSLASGAAMAEDKPLRIGIEAAYPPFAYKTPEGKLAGFDYDIGNALCEEMKVKCQWIEQEFDGLIPALKVRKIDAVISSMSITDERKTKVDFTDKYYASPLALIAKKGSELRPDLELLKGKKVGVQRGTVSDNFATKYWDGKGLQIVRYAKQDEAYLDLRAGRLDAAFVDYLEAYGGFLTKPEGEGYDVAGDRLFGRNAEEKAVIGEGIGIAVRKRDKELTEKLNQALAAIRANGKYDAIQKKYFPMDIYGN